MPVAASECDWHGQSRLTCQSSNQLVFRTPCCSSGSTTKAIVLEQSQLDAFCDA